MAITRQQVIDLYQAETGRMPSEDEITYYAGAPGQEGTGLYGETLDPAEIAQFKTAPEAQAFAQATIPGAGDLPPIKDPVEVEGSTLDPYLRPYLQTGLQKAEQLFLTGAQPSMFPEQMYVDPSQQRLAALQQAEDIATAPSPMLAEAQEAYRRALGQTALTAQGAFLGGSPYQQQMLEAATRPLTQQFTESVIPGISSQFSQAGRYGSGAMERALGTAAETYGRALGDVTTNIAYQDYLNERARQQQAIAQQAVLAQQAPQMYQQQFLPSTALQDVGMAREAIEALPLEEQIQRYQYQQQLPYQQLGGYLSSVYGTPMGSLAQFPDAPQPSTLGQGLAGAALGSFLGGQFGRGGLGAVLGGIGGILGL